MCIPETFLVWHAKVQNQGHNALLIPTSESFIARSIFICESGSYKDFDGLRDEIFWMLCCEVHCESGVALLHGAQGGFGCGGAGNGVVVGYKIWLQFPLRIDMT